MADLPTAKILAECSLIRELLVETREIIAKAKDILAEPAPTTFLGQLYPRGVRAGGSEAVELSLN